LQQSKDERVQGFLETMQQMDSEKYEILQGARAIVFSTDPEVEERFIYGGTMFCWSGQDIGGVFASKKHVSFEFSQGVQFDDPDKVLEGAGKFRRHLKLRQVSDIVQKHVADFVKQAIG
jgi:hypothetical protein